ncbi:MAG: V-type ATPase subunit [Candidatus Improbicoccus devescovinae]|nr:MAG: V-type ATPase subunit [Candidatus Improbicoccus devescovinae]
MCKFISTAAYVKVRALYSKRILNPESFNKLFSCKNILEIAEFISNAGYYPGILTGSDKNELHRGELEARLRENFFNSLSHCVEFDKTINENFVNYIQIKTEVSNILRFLIFLKSGNVKDCKLCLPNYFVRYTKINFNNFNNIVNYEQFMENIKFSVYYKILKSLGYLKVSEIDINTIETLLYSYFFEFIMKYVKDNLSKAFLKIINNFYVDYIDAMNLIRIVRLRKNYNISDSYLKSLMFKFPGYNIRKIYKFASIKNFDDLVYKVKQIKIFKKFNNHSFLDNIDKIPKSIKFIWAKRNIKFSNLPIVISLSYIFLKEIEIINITNIIEGKRYELKQDEVEKMLIR